MVSLFPFFIMLVHSMLVMILDKVNKCLLQQEKKQVKSHAGGKERVCIIAIARVCYRGNVFQSFLYVFLQGLALVYSGKVSVIMR